jgi:tRNA threonylcarbamoyladenosine biosynthesis protein TsaE
MLIRRFKDEESMVPLAALLARHLSLGMIIYLSGELGAGKTTLVRLMLNTLGVKEKVKSPTYTLVESYCIGERQYYHFDCYRLHTPEELLTIGLDDYLRSDAICFIEWAEHAEGVLPAPDLTIQLAILDAGREVKIAAMSEAGAKMLRVLQSD